MTVPPKHKFKKKESFTHKLAKELLHKWLTENWGRVDGNIHNTIKFINQKTGNEVYVSGSQADFVFMEYPITDCYPNLIDECEKKCSLWDMGEWTGRRDCDYRSKEKYCPCLQCKWFNFSKLEYVVDIAIEHKGLVQTIFEIVNKHPTPSEKVLYLTGQGVNVGVYEISAKHILGQIKKPYRLFVKRPDFWNYVNI